jgi:hypothetical protein
MRYRALKEMRDGAMQLSGRKDFQEEGKAMGRTHDRSILAVFEEQLRSRGESSKQRKNGRASGQIGGPRPGHGGIWRLS